MNLEDIEKLLEAITPGPWEGCYHLRNKTNDEACGCGYRGSIWGGDQSGVICEMGSTVIKDEEGLEPPRYERTQELANAKFISVSRELMPKLLAIAKAAKMVAIIAERERWEAIEILKDIFKEVNIE